MSVKIWSLNFDLQLKEILHKMLWKKKKPFQQSSGISKLDESTPEVWYLNQIVESNSLSILSLTGKLFCTTGFWHNSDSNIFLCGTKQNSQNVTLILYLAGLHFHRDLKGELLNGFRKSWMTQHLNQGHVAAMLLSDLTGFGFWNVWMNVWMNAVHKSYSYVYFGQTHPTLNLGQLMCIK